MLAGTGNAALKTAARLLAGRRCIQTFTTPTLRVCSRETAMEYRETEERGKFFLLLTLTKHFLFFFPSN
jgi:hypothetical protein